MDLKVEERALIAFFESDHDLFCCAVLELVITEEKLDFDLEIEKVFLARSLCRFVLLSNFCFSIRI